MPDSMHPTSSWATSPWSAPARFAARFHPGIAAALGEDATLLDRMPHASWIPWAVVAAVAALSLFRLGFTDVYTESYLFYFVAVLAAFVSPVLGVLFFAGHAVADLTRGFVFGWGLLGRMISLWLLWLLVVDIPLAVRSTERAARRQFAPLGALGAGRNAKIVGAAMAAALAFIWSLAVPTLVRPLFTWRGVVPTVIAMVHLQVGWPALLAGAIVAALLGSYIRSRWGDHDPATVRPDNGAAAVPSVMADLIRSSLVVLALAGLITGALDVTILLAAAFGSRWVVPRLLRIEPLRRRIVPIPYAVRFLTAFALSYVVARLVMSFWFTPLASLGGMRSEFLPVVVSVALGMIIFGVLLSAEGGGSAASSSGAGTPSTARILIPFAILMLLPNTAYADNCGGLIDCYGTTAAAAAAAAGAAAAGGWGGGRGRRPN